MALSAEAVAEIARNSEMFAGRLLPPSLLAFTLKDCHEKLFTGEHANYKMLVHYEKVPDGGLERDDGLAVSKAYIRKILKDKQEPAYVFCEEHDGVMWQSLRCVWSMKSPLRDGSIYGDIEFVGSHEDMLLFHTTVSNKQNRDYEADERYVGIKVEKCPCCDE